MSNLSKELFANSKMEKSIDDLPPELFGMILERCDINDLFICRLVCKKWKAAVAKAPIEELVFQMNEISKENEELCWFHTDKPVKNVIDIDIFIDPKYHLLESKLFNLHSLKRLRIDYVLMKGNFDFNFINTFQNLEQLEIKPKHFHGSFELNLPNLKVLFLNNVKDGGTLTIIAPKLTVLACHNWLSALDIKQPETVKELDVHIFEHDITEFKNVESLRIRYAEPIIATLKSNFLKHMKMLKELKLDYASAEHGDWPDFDDVKEILTDLVNEKNLLQRDLKIYFSNQLVENIDQAYGLKGKNFE